MIHRILLTTVLLLSASPFLSGQRLLEPRELHERVAQGIDLILRQEYVRADSIFKEVTIRYPESPAGYLFRIAVLQSKALDYEEILEQYELESLLDQAQKQIDEILRRDPRDAWGHYFAGTLHIYDSFARVQRGDWFGGVTKGLSAVSSFRNALEYDSALTDSYAGIGTYLYWKSKRTEFLHWLPFVSDDREEGIQYLRRCALRGEYNKYVAINSLIIVFLEEGKYEEANRYADTVLGLYPRNRSFLWGKATALDRMGNPERAAGAYKRLLNEILSDSAENRYNELVCRLNLSKNLLHLGKLDETMEHLKVVSAMSLNSFKRHLRSRAKPKIEEAQALLRNRQKSSSH